MNFTKEENEVNIKMKTNVFVSSEEYEKIRERNKEFLTQNKLYSKSSKKSNVYLKETMDSKISNDMKKIVNLRIEN